MIELSVLIRNARVIDGTGNPWFHGEVALAGDRIVGVGPRGWYSPGAETEIVDAEGMVVCPGFIDIQSHSILPLMLDGRSVSKITQGVTTEIMGEGWTPAPFGGLIKDPLARSFFALDVPQWRERMFTWGRLRDWLEAVETAGVSPNIGSFLGGGTLREYAMGMAMGKPSDAQMETMRRIMAEAMEDGAFGVSYALIYAPDTFAASDEIVDVCKVVAVYNGIYITHMRSEGDHLYEGVAEALEIARRADLPVEIYHLKAAGPRNDHKLLTVIESIQDVRNAGLDVTADMYPYTASSTGLASVLPPWAQADDQFYANLRDPETRARIKQEALHPSGGWEAMADLCTPQGVMPIGFRKPENQQYVGKRLSEIAALRGQDWVDAAMDLCLSEAQWISTVYFMLDEENVRLQLQQPWIKISSDAGGFDPAWAEALGPCHPRAYGTYTRVLGRYVRDEQILGIEDAVRKMSGAVAARLGLHDRGFLRAGAMADVVIFDPETVNDQATYADPHRLSVGVRDVWVNGERVLRAGAHTGATPGRIVNGPGRALAERRRKEERAQARQPEKEEARALKFELKAQKAQRKEQERALKVEAMAQKAALKAAKAAEKSAKAADKAAMAAEKSARQSQGDPSSVPQPTQDGSSAATARETE